MINIEDVSYHAHSGHFSLRRYHKRIKHRLRNLFLVMLALPAIAQSNEEVIDGRFLKSLFPGSSVVHARLDGRESVALLRDISLRGEQWFIPLDEIVRLDLDKSLAVMAVPIHRYLPTSDDMGFTTRLPDSSFPKPKLQQVMFYDPGNNTFLGKPDGFPLASDGWQDWVKVDEIQPVSRSTNAAVIRYTVGEFHKIQVVAYAKGKVFTSAVLDDQDVGGLSGYDISVNYADWIKNGSIISTQMTTTCNESDAEDCKAQGMAKGTFSKRLPVLQLPE